MSSAWILRSLGETSFVRWSSSILSISRANSSDSDDRFVGTGGDAIDIERMLGRTVGGGTGEDRDELGVDSLDGGEGEGERYIGFSGGSLNSLSPEVSRGYNDEGPEDMPPAVNLAGGPQYALMDNLGSTGLGRLVGMVVGWVPGAVLRGTMVRIDLVM